MENDCGTAPCVLNVYERETFYTTTFEGGGAEGYTDYPVLGEPLWVDFVPHGAGRHWEQSEEGCKPFEIMMWIERDGESVREGRVGGNVLYIPCRD